MKRFIYVVVLLFVATSCTADLEEQNAFVATGEKSEKIINSSTSAQEGELLVRFNTSAESRLAECATRTSATRTGINGVDAILDKVGGYAVEQLFMVTDKNRDKVHASGMHLWYVIKFDKSNNLDDVAADLAKVSEIEYVEFSRKIKRLKPKQPTVTSRATAQTRAYGSLVSDIPFNDPYKAYLWGLDNQGSKSQISYYKDLGLSAPIVDADVNAVPAWRLCKGDPSIVVAVVDEGVMYSHEDLVDNYAVNTAELNGTSNKDDDGNGYKDDIYGYNFVTSSSTISYNKEGDTGHGTHVAGIVSAVNNNGIGISSIAGGSGNRDGVKVFSAQIFSGENVASASNTARAIQYAADRGAHILQCSWGYEGGDITNDSEYKYYASVEAAAIDYFIANGGTADGPIAGGLAIFAAGNETYALPGYPSAYEPCISVASINCALKPAYYTNYNYGTDISAPGGSSLYSRYDDTPCTGEILSTVPSDFSSSGLSGYAIMQGTSQACPHVSGVAALGLSYAQKLGKRYTADEFRSMLLSATNDINSYLTGSIYLEFTDNTSLDIYYSDYKGKMGAGYIDAYKLLLQVDGTPYVTLIAGQSSKIDLSQYFGSGIANMHFSKAEVSAEDMAAVGWSNVSYSDGKLNVTCTKSGTAIVNVTMYVGGSSYNSSKPYPTEVTKSFVVMVRSSLASNNGWL